VVAHNLLRLRLRLRQLTHHAAWQHLLGVKNQQSVKKKTKF
jgi:hypothetical protein